jgi:rhodanese-related sulfurtransferase
VKTVTLISIKGPVKIAPEKLATYEMVEQLVAQGPGKGRYLLVDSRPLPRVQEGTIPTAVNLPFTTSGFDKLAAEKLPADKSTPIVFFCQGITCTLSPNSMKRAEALGYTNAKVYREGWPEWTQRNVGVIAASHFNDAWLAKGIPHVLVDARAEAEAREGSIPGAVRIAPDGIAAALKAFPDKSLKPPVMVYDGGDGQAAFAVARAITKAGYPYVTVIPGGFRAWNEAKYPVNIGKMKANVAYVPRLRPGQLTISEFKALAGKTPADTLILDVRNADEAADGMIRGAKLVPEEEILARLAEIPKDRRIVTHCITGVRAEMAYHKLRENGYNVAFVKGDVEIDKAGRLTINPN